MSKTLVLNPLTLDPDAHSDAFGLSDFGPSKTVQADAADSDINNIVARFGLTAELPYGVQVPEYADYSDIPNDYHAAMMYINDSDDAFMQLPADHRARFDNDPGRFLDFMSDASNRDEAISLGYIPPPLSTDQAKPDSGLPSPDGGTTTT